MKKSFYSYTVMVALLVLLYVTRRNILIIFCFFQFILLLELLESILFIIFKMNNYIIRKLGFYTNNTISKYTAV